MAQTIDAGPLPAGETGAADDLAAAKLRLNAVDGLRGVACLVVLAHHLWLYCGQFQYPMIAVGGFSLSPSLPMFIGYLGVDLFFVISGFCLSYSLIGREKRVDWRTWFEKRAARILPPYYASVALFCGLAWLLRRNLSLQFGLAQPHLKLPKPRETWDLLTLTDSHLNPSYWTLVIEAKWYLAFPFVLWAVVRFGAWRVLPAAVVLALAGITGNRFSLRFEVWLGQLMQYGPTFVLGIIAAAQARKSHPDWLQKSSLPLFLLAAAVAAACHPTPPNKYEPYTRLAVGSVLSYFFILAAVNEGWMNRILASRTLGFCGRFSFSLYLIHEPIIRLLYEATRPCGWSSRGDFAFAFLFVAPFCLAAGCVFHLLFERPSLRLVEWVSKRGKTSRAA